MADFLSLVAIVSLITFLAGFVIYVTKDKGNQKNWAAYLAFVGLLVTVVTAVLCLMVLPYEGQQHARECLIAEFGQNASLEGNRICSVMNRNSCQTWKQNFVVDGPSGGDDRRGIIEFDYQGCVISIEPVEP